jgi:hypothetical protein
MPFRPGRTTYPFVRDRALYTGKGRIIKDYLKEKSRPAGGVALW